MVDPWISIGVGAAHNGADAWTIASAIGTIGAVFVALGLGFVQHARDRAKSRQTQFAVANALFYDLRSARALLHGLQSLLNGEIFNGLRLESEAEYAEWCARLERVPMPSFERFSTLLHQLDDIAAPVIHAYGLAIRVSAICRAQRETRRSDRDCIEFVRAVGGTFQVYIDGFERAMAALQPYVTAGASAAAASRQHG